MKLIVYYDENYPTWWVSRRVSKKIANYLKNRNFVIFSAEDLAKWMRKSIEEDICDQSTVVFSQDIVPDTVCRWWSPSTLIREYLDSGGNIVWLGDSPFYYWGQHPSRHSEFEQWSEEKKKSWRLLEDRDGKIALTWDTDGPFNTLGVVPVYMDAPSSKVQITEYGKSCGIVGLWYGLRPILMKASDCRKRNIKIIATASQPERPISKKKAWLYKSTIKEGSGPLSNTLESLSKLVGLIPAFLALISAVYTLFAGFSVIVPLSLFLATIICSVLFAIYWFYWTREILASGWLKKFGERNSTSGFLRIWDCQLDRITETMLEELYQIVLTRTKHVQKNV